MSITIHNTLTGKKEAFVPQADKSVAMYVCGVTPYDEAHLGHARVYVTFDIVRRHFGRSGYTVKYIQNFTDVDDKIIARANERKISPKALADTCIADYFTQMDKLNIARADAYPRVTEMVPQIVAFIDTLVQKKKAYVVDGDVYYAVKKFAPYGSLSKRNIEELQTVARVYPGEKKKDPLDFALWKGTKPEEPAEVSWDSPWGKGRPGWHIECSVMSTHYLGPTLDIHGGGQDLIFPHHENEIAQSEAATGKPFVRYWMHNGFVTINHEKMSKSLGNFFTLREIFEKYHPRVVRYFLLSQHYRTPLDFSDDKLVAARSALEGLDEVYQKLTQAASKETAQPDPAYISRFREMLDDDFNTEKALSVLHDLKHEAANGLTKKPPAELAVLAATMKSLMEDSLGIPVLVDAIPAEALELKTKRETARREKRWSDSDALRAQLDTLGYRVEDNPGGVSTLIKKA